MRGISFALVAALAFGAGLFVGGSGSTAAVVAHIPFIGDGLDATPDQGADLMDFWKAWNALNANYVVTHASSSLPTSKERVYGAIQGLTASYDDPYTVFFPPKEAKEFADTISGSFSGVGMEIGIKEGVLVVIAPLKGMPAEAAGVKAGDQISNYQDGPDNQLLLVISNGFIKQGYPLSVTVAEDLNPVKRNIRQFQTRFAITAIVMLLLLVVLQALILRHSMKSLSRIHEELQSLQQGEANQLNADAPTELRPLVNEINHLLVVMEQRLRRSRDALGDLAHAVKRPLTIIQQLTDKNRNALPADLNAGLVRQVTEINQLTDRILKRARLAGHGHSSARFSFLHDLPQLIETLDIIYNDKSIANQVDFPEEANCPIDREDMLELLGNLLDNAYKWANKRVNITVAINPELTICIEDDGPGTDPNRFEQLDKRGVRLDETKKGYGFGLSIASDIVREYSGTLLFSTSNTLGGFRVDITLPIEGVFINPKDK